MSTSENWRSKGNQAYAEAGTEGLGPTTRNQRLQSAKNYYYRALQTANNDDEHASAAKNYAQTAFYMASSMKSVREEKVKVEFYLKESVQHFSKALTIGIRSKSETWQDNLFDVYEERMIDILEMLGVDDDDQRIRGLEIVTQNMLDGDRMKTQIFLKMGEILFQRAVIALQDKLFKVALNNLKESYRPLNEVIRLAKGDSFFLSEANVLDTDINFHTRCAEALQAIYIGDEILRGVLEDEELVNMSMVWETVDWYKKAVILSGEIEIEVEAIAHSRLGVLYDKVLKSEYNAKRYFKRCMELALTLLPKNPVNEHWYKVCAEAIEKYQKEVLERDEKKMQEEKDELLKDEKKSLKVIKEAMEKCKDTGLSGVPEFLAVIYKTYPPKNPAHKLGKVEKTEVNSKSIKKILLKANMHYHPDKQDERKYGKKWKAIAGEIIKNVNIVYQMHKFGE